MRVSSDWMHYVPPLRRPWANFKAQRTLKAQRRLSISLSLFPPRRTLRLRDVYRVNAGSTHQWYFMAIYGARIRASSDLISSLFLSGCWVVWEVDTCPRVGVAAIRWCVEVWASPDMVPHPGPPTVAGRSWNRCPDTLPEDEEPSPPATTRAAPSFRHGSSSAILCEFAPSNSTFFTDIYLMHSYTFTFASLKENSLIILSLERLKVLEIFGGPNLSFLGIANLKNQHRTM